MGVKGLWRLLLPIGRRISIETLEGKVLAIDASIWLTQFIKAMRDVDTGSVKPGAHLIGFFRRLCKLRYHGIRPIFVFDGATPEIKLREIQQRRKRREQLSITANGEDSIQRMAKRILIQQLKQNNKTKRGVGTTTTTAAGGKISIAKKSVVGGSTVSSSSSTPNNNNNNNVTTGRTNSREEEEGSDGVISSSQKTDKNNQSGTTTASSSFAPGFYDPEAENDDMKEETIVQAEPEIITTTTTTTPKLAANNQVKSHPKDVIDLLDDDKEYFEEPLALEQSDWDTAIVRPLNDEEHDDDDDKVDDDHHSQTKKRYKQLQRRRGGDNEDEFDVEYVASLSSIERKDVVEDAKRRQRLVSRKEFMKVAADPVGLSQCQLRNFLKSVSLNQNIVKMAKKVVEKEDNGIGDTLASDRTRRIVFEKDEEDNNDDDDGNDVSRNKKNSKGRRLHEDHNNNTSSTSSNHNNNGSKRRKLSVMDSSSDSEEVDWEDGGESDQDETKKSKSKHGGAIVDFQSEGDDDDDDDIGGGFLLPKGGDSSSNDGFFQRMAVDTNTKIPATTLPSNLTMNVDSNDDDDDEPGGFLPTNDNGSQENRNTQSISPPTKTSHRRVINLYASSDEEDEGGGFLPMDHSATTNDSRVAQELHDEALARAIQMEEQSDAEEDGGFLISTADKTENNRDLLQEGPIVDNVAASQHKERNKDSTSDALGVWRPPPPQHQDQDAMLARAIQEREDIGQKQADELLARRLQNFEENNVGTGDEEELSDDDDDDDTETNNVARKLASSKPKHYGLAQEQEDEILARALQESEAEMAIGMRPNQEPGDTREDLDVKPKAVKTIQGANLKQKINGEPQHLSFQQTPQPRVGKTTGMDGRSDEDSDDDDVDWEDGDDEGEHDQGDAFIGADTCKEQKSQNPPQLNDERFASFGTDRSHDLGFPSMETTDIDEHDPWANDFKPNNASRDSTEAALEQAQATAAKLTDWAGRAFRRAIAVHAEETGTKSTISAVGGVTKEKAHQSAQVGTKIPREENAYTNSNNGDDEKKEMEEPNGFSYDVASKTNEKTLRPPPSEAEEIDVSHSKEHSLPPPPKRTSGKQGNASSSSAWPEVVSNNGSGEIDLDLLDQYKDQWTEERNQQERDMDTVTDEMRTEAIQLLQLFGVPYVEAPAEAEAQCVELEKLGLVDGVVTEDSDAFVFGGKVIYKNIFDDQKYVEVYRAKDAETEMNISHDGMVALAMLMGGDYTEGVKGVGIVNGMEILEAFNVSQKGVEAGLKSFRKWLDGFDPSDSLALAKGERGRTREEIFHKNHHTARTRWLAPKHFPDERVMSAYLKPVVDTSNEKFSWGVPDMDKLIVFCNRHAGWDVNETRKLLDPVIKKVESGSRQTRIDSFMRYEDGIKFAQIQSKRLQDVLNAVKDPKQDKK